jgi:ubiquinone/menaquinone biosynthesis C-methylase UbiE
MPVPSRPAQSLAVKRAQVEFHNFASLGEPERALGKYTVENQRRGEMITRHLGFIGAMTPFLEIGANVGHTSYLLANHFGADGFALDISADALRHGKFLMDHWGLAKAPVRMGGDALNLPFRDGSLRFVMTHQTLSQFLDIEAVFREVMRVLQPGGVFFFSEEPIRRILSARLYRCPYYNTMKPWERKLYDWGLLGFVAKDVIGAHQEESFGIRQNHRMRLADWHALVQRHFIAQEYEIYVTETGRVEHWVRALGRRIDKYGSDWVPARLLGGTLAAFCRKAGTAPEQKPMAAFETFLRCPDCSAGLARRLDECLVCSACGYEASDEGGVYNLIRSAERRDLYPGDRPDLIDFSVAGHEAKLVGPWEELEGVFGGKYRWLTGEPARARLTRIKAGPQKLRVRGYAHHTSFEQGGPVTISVSVNGQLLPQWTLDRVGLFVLEADIPDAPEYLLEIKAAPRWQSPPDERWFTVNLSMIRLVDRE